MKHHITLRSFGRTIAEFDADLSENEVLDLETSVNWHSSLFRVWIRPATGEPAKPFRRFLNPFLRRRYV